VVLPPDKDFALVCAVKDQALNNEAFLEIDPVHLRDRYGIYAPRSIINKNATTCIVVCRNPYAKPVKPSKEQL